MSASPRSANRSACARPHAGHRLEWQACHEAALRSGTHLADAARLGVVAGDLGTIRLPANADRQSSPDSRRTVLRIGRELHQRHRCKIGAAQVEIALVEVVITTTGQTARALADLPRSTCGGPSSPRTKVASAATYRLANRHATPLPNCRRRASPTAPRRVSPLTADHQNSTSPKRRVVLATHLHEEGVEIDVGDADRHRTPYPARTVRNGAAARSSTTATPLPPAVNGSADTVR